MSETTQNESQESGKQAWMGYVVRFLAYWFKLIAQPALAILFVIGLAWLFGYAQRNFKWFNDAATSVAESDAEEDSLYACSMLCVFVKAPGRCPVCGMELQKIEVPGDPKDIFGVTIDPTARRLANIKTVAALNIPVSRKIEALGAIAYDETTESTISAYVDGRIVDLFVGFTGARVEKGEPLAVLYSPDLYADQVGLLNAKKLMQQSRSSDERINASNRRLYESARRRLMEFGLPATQVDAIEQRGEPDSRIRIVASGSGTCVEKLVKKGDYIKTGMPIMKLADLSNVWLMLEMFPEDIGSLMIGQSVTVTIRSQVGQKFEGKISFIDPMVNRETNTVKVRVEIPNEAGLIKIGDFGKAIIQTNHADAQALVVVPREAVLINGSDSIAYVETEPGRFEFRKVAIAEILGDKISLSSGIKPGEQVVASGVFMLDSTFNIQGKVSLIDPNRAASQDESKKAEGAEAREIEESFSTLSVDDRKLAEEQIICPVTEVRLGTMGMGTPIRVDVNGTLVMICCEGCRKGLLNEPEKYLKILEDYRNGKGIDPANEPENEPPSTDLPQMELPKMELPKMDLPDKEAE